MTPALAIGIYLFGFFIVMTIQMCMDEEELSVIFKYSVVWPVAILMFVCAALIFCFKQARKLCGL